MRPRSVVAALALAVLLGGCASPAAEPTTPPEVTTPSPDPAPTAAAGPEVRVGASCEDFGELAAVQTLLKTASDVRLNRPVPGAGLTPFVQQQYGSLDCWWTPGGTGGAEGPYVHVTVAPEVTDAQWNEIVPLASGAPGVVTGGFAGEAYSNCRRDAQGRSCRLDDRVDGWYLQVELRSSEAAAEGESRTWGNPFLQHAVDVVSALPEPSAPWQPESTTPFSGCGAATDDGALASDLGYPAVDVAFVAPSPQAGASWVAADGLGFLICYLQASSASASQNLRFEVLPGGSWAWDAASAGGTAVDGIGDAAVAFTTGAGAVVVFRAGTTLAAVTADREGSPSGADLGAVAATTARHLVTAIG